jgi:hypothetical protein
MITFAYFLLIFLACISLIAFFKRGRQFLYVALTAVIGYVWIMYRNLTANTSDRKAKREFINKGYEHAKLRSTDNTTASSRPTVAPQKPVNTDAPGGIPFPSNSKSKPFRYS